MTSFYIRRRAKNCHNKNANARGKFYRRDIILFIIFCMNIHRPAATGRRRINIVILLSIWLWSPHFKGKVKKIIIMT